MNVVPKLQNGTWFNFIITACMTILSLSFVAGMQKLLSYDRELGRQAEHLVGNDRAIEGHSRDIQHIVNGVEAIRRDLHQMEVRILEKIEERTYAHSKP